MMERSLGRSGIEVSALGMGCWAIGGPWRIEREGKLMSAGWGQVDDAESVRAINAALDAGITFFDTAANSGCGHSERILGKALGSRRSQAVIATKFGHIIDEQAKVMHGDNVVIAANLRADCEASLRRLDTDVIDIYQLHEGTLDDKRALEVRDILERLVHEGKIRAYGWSTDHVDRAELFADGPACASIQFSLNVLQGNDHMLDVCERHQLACINKKPLASGFLTGKLNTDSSYPEDDYRHVVDFKQARFADMLEMVDGLRDILTSGGRTMAQGALAWIWARSHRTIPIPGARTEKQVAENAGALAFGPLDDASVREANEIIATIRERLAGQTMQKDEREK